MRGNKRIGETRTIFFRERVDFFSVFGLLTKDDFDRPLGPHDRDLGGRPGVIDVSAEVLGRHHIVRPTVRLARDDLSRRTVRWRVCGGGGG